MEKYPKKRAYVRGKLKKFLDEKGVTKQFIANCKKANPVGWKNRDCKKIGTSFPWVRSNEGFVFWEKLNNEFEGLDD